MLRTTTTAACLLLLVASSCARRPAGAPPPAGTPRLVLFIVVDQGRADYFVRFASYFEHGIGRLLRESTVFTETRHDHAMTKTAPGHATLVSGMHPSRHGIIGNDWYDRDSGQQVEADEDDRYTPERAPTRVLATTLGDWLKQTYPDTKVFGASIKSRSAITSAGREADAAFWYDDETGRFTSSDYYPRASPDWLEVFHRNPLPDRLFGSAWESLPGTAEAARSLGLATVDRGIVRGQLDRPIGGSVTHPDEGYYRDLKGESPFADAYLGELARAIVDGEALGADPYPDLLALGFSSLDYIGHRYGPNSPETFDTLMRLDRVVGTLLDHIDAAIGLEHTLVSFSSDHGVAPIPEYADGRRFWVEERGCLQRAAMALELRFGQAEWLAADLVFDRAVLDARGVDQREAESALADAIAACPGVERAWTRSELDDEDGGRDPAARLFRHSFHAGRSADVLIQAEAGSITSSSIETNHGSIYDYDTHVPWLLRVPGSVPRTVEEPVRTVDVAPTLAALLGIEPAEATDGSPRLDLLSEASVSAGTPAATRESP